MIRVGMNIASSMGLNIITWNVLSTDLRGGPFEYDIPLAVPKEQQLYAAVRNKVYGLFGDFQTYKSKELPVKEGPTIGEILNTTMPFGEGTYGDFIFPLNDHLQVKNPLYRGPKRGGPGLPVGQYNKTVAGLEFLDLPAEQRLEEWKALTPKIWAYIDRKVYRHVKPLALNQATKRVPNRHLNQWLQRSGDRMSQAPPTIDGHNGLDFLAVRLYDVIMLYARDMAFQQFDDAAETWEDIRKKYSIPLEIAVEIRETMMAVGQLEPDAVLLQEIDVRWFQSPEWRKVEEEYVVIAPPKPAGPDNSVVLLRRASVIGQPDSITVSGTGERDVVADCAFGDFVIRIGSLHLTSGYRKAADLQKDLKNFVFSRKLADPNVTIIGGDFNYDFQKAPIQVPAGWTLAADMPGGDLASSAKRRSLLQPQIAKGELVSRGLLDNAFVAGPLKFVDFSPSKADVLPETLFRNLPHRMFGFLPDENVMLPNIANLGPVGRSDHLPVAFSISIFQQD